jgi:hypothetical protein
VWNEDIPGFVVNLKRQWTFQILGCKEQQNLWAGTRLFTRSFAFSNFRSQRKEKTK